MPKSSADGSVTPAKHLIETSEHMNGRKPQRGTNTKTKHTKIGESEVGHEPSGVARKCETSAELAADFHMLSCTNPTAARGQTSDAKDENKKLLFFVVSSGQGTSENRKHARISSRPLEIRSTAALRLACHDCTARTLGILLEGQHSLPRWVSAAHRELAPRKRGHVVTSDGGCQAGDRRQEFAYLKIASPNVQLWTGWCYDAAATR